jgi:wyosine [tRNA(Phe)-imidazoG37] synthetase (radical SAM superfamily)
MLTKQPLNHSRIWGEQRYVYPVASRRARGISIGINLNLDKICNFGCVYCEVNRGVIPPDRDINLAELESELAATLALAADGSLARDKRFTGLAPDGQLLSIQDIAFSGDGEPTSFRNFDQVVERVIALRDGCGLSALKLVAITNATLFHRPRVRAALNRIHVAGGEVWAKLDAGTAAYYRAVDATTIPYKRILDNLLLLGQDFPLVIQSCFMRLDGVGPDDAEIAAYCNRLADLLVKGGQIARIQLYTVARPPAERHVTSLPASDLESIQERVAAKLPELSIERFDGVWEGYGEGS